MPWHTPLNPKPPVDVNENVLNPSRPPPSRNPNNNKNNVPAPASPQAISSTSSSQEDRAQAHKQKQHAASKQEADSRDNEINSQGTSTEHSMHKEASVQSKHQPRTEAPTVLKSPLKQEADDSRDNEIISRGTTEHAVNKEDMPKDQALLRQRDNGGVTNPDPPVNNNPITVLNINVYVDQPKSVDKNDIAIKENKAPDPKPQNGIVSSKPPSERKRCCTIL